MKISKKVTWSISNSYNESEDSDATSGGCDHLKSSPSTIDDPSLYQTEFDDVITVHEFEEA